MADYVSNYSGDQIDEAVGRALPGGALDTGKAPSGFGYGDKLKNVEATKGETYESFCAKVDAVISTMPADTIMQLVAYPPAIYGYGKTTATLYKYYSNAYAELRGTNSTDGTVTGGWRMRKNTAWEPFEWENPPMQLGVEYRTTERYFRKPVYVCVKQFTGLASGANFSTGITNGETMVRYHARWNGVSIPFINQQDLKNAWSIYLNAASVNSMALWYGSDTFDTTQTLTVTMYYTKSTD